MTYREQTAMAIHDAYRASHEDVIAERDAAIARAEAAERERDAALATLASARSPRAVLVEAERLLRERDVARVYLRDTGRVELHGHDRHAEPHHRSMAASLADAYEALEDEVSG